MPPELGGIFGRLTPLATKVSGKKVGLMGKGRVGPDRPPPLPPPSPAPPPALSPPELELLAAYDWGACASQGL